MGVVEYNEGYNDGYNDGLNEGYQLCQGDKSMSTEESEIISAAKAWGQAERRRVDGVVVQEVRSAEIAVADAAHALFALVDPGEGT